MESAQQKMSDTTGSDTGDVKDTGKSYLESAQQKVSDTAGSGQETGKSYMESAQQKLNDTTGGDVQETTKSYMDSAQQKLSDTTGSNSGDAKAAGKTYLETAQDTAANVAKVVSDTLSGKHDPFILFSFPLSLTTFSSHQTDTANKVSGSTGSK